MTINFFLVYLDIQTKREAMKLSKLLILSSISAMIIALSAFNQPTIKEETPRPSNLKVLPKNISSEELTKVMQGFNAALGVKCNHCHAAKANGEKGLDFVSDANGNKDVARAMMKMTLKINKKYFNEKHEGYIKNINCATCHNGNAEAKTVTLP